MRPVSRKTKWLLLGGLTLLLILRETSFLQANFSRDSFIASMTYMEKRKSASELKRPYPGKVFHPALFDVETSGDKLTSGLLERYLEQPPPGFESLNRLHLKITRMEVDGMWLPLYKTAKCRYAATLTGTGPEAGGYLVEYKGDIDMKVIGVSSIYNVKRLMAKHIGNGVVKRAVKDMVCPIAYHRL